MVKLEKTHIMIITAIAGIGALLVYLWWQNQENEKKQTQQQMIIITDNDNEIERPKGETRQQVYTITTQEKILGHHDPLNWFSVDITNNGPGNLYYSINKRRQSEAPLEAGHTINIPLNVRGIIKKIFLKSDSTTTVYLNAIK